MDPVVVHIEARLEYLARARHNCSHWSARRQPPIDSAISEALTEDEDEDDSNIPVQQGQSKRRRMMMLVMHSADHEVLIGRSNSPGNIQISSDPTISRTHLHIKYDAMLQRIYVKCVGRASVELFTSHNVKQLARGETSTNGRYGEGIVIEVGDVNLELLISANSSRPVGLTLWDDSSANGETSS